MASAEITAEVKGLWDAAKTQAARLENLKADYKAAMAKVHNFTDKFPELMAELEIPPRRTRNVTPKAESEG